MDASDHVQSIAIMQAIQKAFMTFKSLETGKQVGSTAADEQRKREEQAEAERKQKEAQQSRMMQALPPNAAATMRQVKSSAPVIPPSPSPEYDVTVGAFDVVVCLPSQHVFV